MSAPSESSLALTVNGDTIAEVPITSKRQLEQILQRADKPLVDSQIEVTRAIDSVHSSTGVPHP